MLSGEGLKESRYGKRVRFTAGGRKSVIDGPFAETKVKSMEEAVEWVRRRCPDPMPGEETELEIRQVAEEEDFVAK